MRSLDRIGAWPAALPLPADELVEFHAARILLLLAQCGTAGRRINSLTKFAKLDFFARYPSFFQVARQASGLEGAKGPAEADTDETIESAMVRHHYGPWDKRYYQILGHLEARRLIQVSKLGNSYQLALTDLGASKAAAIAALSSYQPLVMRMREIKKVFGRQSGTFLKDLIYRVFDEEVARRRMGETIGA